VPNLPGRVKIKAAVDAPTAPGRLFFGLALTALGLSAVTVVGMTAYSRSMERWVEHSTLVYQTTRSALLDLTGPIPTGNRVILSVAGSDPERAIARFDSVGDMTRDNPAQQTRMRGIRELAGEWATAIRRGAPVAPALAAAVDLQVRQFLTDEQQLYDLRLNRFHRMQIATVVAVVIELAFVGLIVVAYSRRIAQHIAQANVLQRQLEDQAAELEEQTMELEVSNHELRESGLQAEREHETATLHARHRDRATAFLNASLDSAPVAFALVDADLRYVQVNARWAELTGVEVAGHVGRRFDELPFSTDALAPALEVVARVANSPTATLNLQLSGHKASDKRSDGRRWLLSAAPVAPSVGSSGGVAIALLDVTDSSPLAQSIKL
jgi:PAS domain-containing protein